MILWTDSESVEACVLATEIKPNSRHFILREYKVMGFANADRNNLRFCRTKYQRADALTKGADIKQHKLLLDKASIVALFDAGILAPMPKSGPYQGDTVYLKYAAFHDVQERGMTDSDWDEL